MGDAHSDLERETRRSFSYTNFFAAFMLLKEDDEESKKFMLTVLTDGDFYHPLYHNEYFRDERDFCKGAKNDDDRLRNLIEVRKKLEESKEGLRLFLKYMRYSGPYLGEAKMELYRLLKIAELVN